MLPFRSGRAGFPRASFTFLLLALLGCVAFAAEKTTPTAPPKTKKERPKPGEGVTNVPIASGHDAKGLVLPDFDLSGRLRGKLQAGITRRLDEQHIEFKDVRFTTFVPETQTPDLQIVMTTSVFNLKTQVMTSNERASVKRTDFEISGDTMKFEMISRQGTLAGNVKMIVRGKARAPRAEGE